MENISLYNIIFSLNNIWNMLEHFSYNFNEIFKFN